jgi:hypothetical protein
VVLFGVSESELQSVVLQVEAAYRSVGLHINVKKSVPPTKNTVKVLGVSINGGLQRIFVSTADSVSLVYRTINILDGEFVTSHALSRLCGHWCWYFLVRRQFLSILNQCYRFIAIFNTCLDVKRIWSTIHRELLLCCMVVPLLQLDLSTQLCDRFLCTDASSTGYGVVSNNSNNMNDELKSILYKLSSTDFRQFFRQVLAVKSKI